MKTLISDISAPNAGAAAADEVAEATQFPIYGLEAVGIVNFVGGIVLLFVQITQHNRQRPKDPLQ